ncbi:MAG: N-6 DNA methylase [Alistipes sp.]|nr:N-6 DNA methylase [Alistipes sp.]
MTESKTYGRVYTPKFLVELILDKTGYNSYEGIIGKHIIDNSCGDGAFLMEIVSRYCTFFSGSVGELANHLQTYIHGIEIDETEQKKCIANLDKIACKYGIGDVKWDIMCADTLSVSMYNSQMDYVVGNPPYVRVHNLDSSYDNVKSYKFANGGMTDLYLVFFEIGFNMLKPDGQLCYITPSSWLSSLAADNMRRYILKSQSLMSLIDLEHYQAFDKITTYTLISHFKKSHNKSTFDYYTYCGENKNCEFVENLDLQDIYIDSCFYLGRRRDLLRLRNIKTRKSPKYVSVKNGFATLADAVFIGDNVPESPITIRAIKGSTGKWYKCLFPYDEKGKPLTEDEIFENEDVKCHLLAHKDDLLKGRKEYSGWYLYGRTQALSDVYRQKLSINSLVRTKNDLKLVELMSGEGIYSGLYVIANINVIWQDIKNVIASDEFIEYVKLLKKYKSGGYYTYSSKDVEQFINYYLANNEKTSKYVIKQAISRQNPDLFQGVY